MVKSGLEEKPDVPRVSQYRLAAHLSLALILYSLMLYTGLGLVATPTIATPTKSVARLRGVVHGAASLIFFTSLSGTLSLLLTSSFTDIYSLCSESLAKEIVFEYM